MSFDDLSDAAKLLFILIKSPVFSARSARIGVTRKCEAEYTAAWAEVNEFWRSCSAARIPVLAERRRDAQRAKRARM